MSPSTSRSPLVVAGSVADVRAGDAAFVENAIPEGGLRTYSTILDDDDCRAIDARAYAVARTWFTDGAALDPTTVDGVSLGRAWELRATAVLVLALRAERVLRRMSADTGRTAVELRSVGAEWGDAARRLGLEVVASSGPSTDPALAIPDVGRRRPRAANRVLAAIGGTGGPSNDVALVELARWGRAYQRALARRWPITAVNPYGSMLLDALLRGRRIPARFLGDAPLARWPVDVAGLAVPADLPADLLRGAFARDAPAMAASAGVGLAAGDGVAVTAQDVSPSVRAFLLGLRASGGRIVTLEHGISGWYAQQVHTVADVLAAWGARQAEYHRAAGPRDVVVEAVGWPRLSEAVAGRGKNDDPRWDAVFFGQPTLPLSAGSWPEDRLGGHAAVDAYARRHPNRRIGVKDHPAAWAYRSPTPDPLAARPATGDSLELVRSARVVVRSTSTTGLEAMALGRPVVTIASRGPLGGPDFLAEGEAAITVRDARELEEALDGLLADPGEYARRVEAGRAFAREFVSGLDDPRAAPRRLVEIVDRLRSPDGGG